ncbi:50S ribosomal protein L29 [Terriglobus sp.]|uniref:50S ribosomal protein L29 n=1 Tax=Terriglobus sp. TaxID=1889013 RepID=UPI003B004B25
MKIDQIQSLTAEELKQQEAQTGEKLFRIRFQKSLGQNEGMKNLRELKKDIARIKTVARQRELGHATAPTESTQPSKKSRKKKDA